MDDASGKKPADLEQTDDGLKGCPPGRNRTQPPATPAYEPGERFQETQDRSKASGVSHEEAKGSTAYERHMSRQRGRGNTNADGGGEGSSGGD